ncbi:MAG: HAMP domain-containing histidine kinase [Lachnospiraceae bacterium]|jgi:signal transduction histidine kinase|nr:HAMP domain-containing histidine kinase [Lachnospiraceae bacterium]
MTKRLRLKFITITMSILTIMLCSIMSMIYFFTKMNLENNNIHMMRGIAGNPLLLRFPNEHPDDLHLPYFVLQLSPQGSLITANGAYYDLSDESFLESVVDAALSVPGSVGIIDQYNLRFFRMDIPMGQVLVCTDISSERSTLRDLMRNCILTGIVSFFVFLFISIHLADWAVSPVDRAWKQQRQFVADASHELKTPLTVIITNAELMENAFSSNILVMAKQMSRLVEQMLELAKADDIQSETVFSQVDLSRLISDAVLPFEPVFFEKHLALYTDIAEDLWVKGDPSQLRQVLEILLDNAGKYSCQKGTTWITLRKQGKNRCLLSVANKGQPIPEQDLKNIFKRFYRVDKTRTRTGSFGLGLSIAETIIIRHKGNIWAESREGINTFCVELHLINGNLSL